MHECNILSFVNNIMMKMCLSSFELYFQKRQNNYDVRRKNQLVVPVVRMCLGEKAVRVTGASLWNRLHKDMVQYRLMKCFKGKLKNYYMSEYHMWFIDMWSCFVVMKYDSILHCSNLKNDCFRFDIWSILSHLFFYLFFLVVSKMSFALPWQPQTDNITCIMLS